MPGVETSFAAISYAVGAAAFLILLVLLAAGRRRRLPGALLAAACAATLAWTAAAAVHYGFGGGYARLVAALEVVRSIAWTNLGGNSRIHDGEPGNAGDVPGRLPPRLRAAPNGLAG